VTAYASVYTLVLMSLDRYLAVVHPIRSMTIRTVRNATGVAVLAWAIILVFNYYVLVEYEVIKYPFNGEERLACINGLIAGLHNTSGAYGYDYYFDCHLLLDCIIPVVRMAMTIILIVTYCWIA